MAGGGAGGAERRRRGGRGESYRPDRSVSRAARAALSLGSWGSATAPSGTVDPLPAAPRPSPAATLPEPALPPGPGSRGGRLGRATCPRPPTGAAHLPLPRVGVASVSQSPHERRWHGAAIQRGGGRCSALPVFSPPTPPQVGERRVPARARGGREWGGGVGSGLCPDTCLPRRPGLAAVWREGGSLAPRPVQPPRIKGRLRRGETSGRPGGRGAWVRSRGGAEARVQADPQETSAADLVWDTGSGCRGEGETSRLSWLPGQVAGDVELTPTACRGDPELRPSAGMSQRGDSPCPQLISGGGRQCVGGGGPGGQ